MAALQTSFKDFIKIGDIQQCLLKLTGQNCCSSYLYLEMSSAKAVAVYLKLKEQFVKFPPEIMPCACCWSVGNHNHFNRDSDIEIFLNGDVLLNGS